MRLYLTSKEICPATVPLFWHFMMNLTKVISKMIAMTASKAQISAGLSIFHLPWREKKEEDFQTMEKITMCSTTRRWLKWASRGGNIYPVGLNYVVIIAFGAFSLTIHALESSKDSEISCLPVHCTYNLWVPLPDFFRCFFHNIELSN